jgi:large subunit ribosomal protein L18
MSGSKRRLARKRRHAGIRKRVRSTETKPRLSVFRSINHIYAQLIDDTRGHTLTSASTIEPEIKGEAVGKTKTEVARLVGSLIAKRALEQNITRVVFDRGGYKYHGRTKSLAQAARDGGLLF